MGIPLVAGTDFADLDDAAAPPQAIVNQAFVARYAPDGTVIGRRIVSRSVAHVIVGVARTSTYDAFGEAPTPLVLYSYRDRPLAAAEMHLRTRPGTELAMASAIRRARRRPRSEPAGVRRAHAARAHRAEPGAAAHTGADVPGARTAAPAARRDRRLCRRRLRRLAADQRDRRAAGAGGDEPGRRPADRGGDARRHRSGRGRVHDPGRRRWICTWYGAGSATCPCWSACRCCSWRSGPWRRGCRPDARAACSRRASSARSAGLALPCAAVTILREHSISRIYLSACRTRFGSSRPRSSRRWPTPPASPSSRRCATASCPRASCSNCSRSSRPTCPSTSRCCAPSRSS